MNTNIGCSYPGCNNKVIGQCQGFQQKGCGRFYCAVHSRQNLCPQCTEELEMEEIFREYTRLAKDVNKRMIVRGGKFIYTALFVGFFAYLFRQTNLLPILLPIAVILFVIGCVALIIDRINLVSEISKKVPGFNKFYHRYQTQQTLEVFKMSLSALGIAMLIGLGVAAAAQRAQTLDDIRTIRKDLNL